MIEAEDIEKRKAAIYLEIEKMKAEAVKNGKRIHFNNFWSWLNHPRSAWRRDVGDKQKFPNKYLIDENEVIPGKREDNPVTFKEYFRLLDDLVERFGLKDKIEQLVSKEWDHRLSDEERTKAEYDLQEALIPLYVELRLMDFTDSDIC